MELRTLRYFLTVAQEGSISDAAKILHVTQPTLSRQLAALEDEFSRQLYTRGRSGIKLTDYGLMLQSYAESIIELADKAKEEILLPERTVSGTVRIAAGESQAMNLLAEAADIVRAKYPGVSFALYSGTTLELKEGLMRGHYDVMLECEIQESPALNQLVLPIKDVWGVVARRDSALAKLSGIAPKNLKGQSIIASRQALSGTLREWGGSALDDADIIATMSLPTNARFLVQQGMGSLLTYEGLVDTSKESGLVFIPFDPPYYAEAGIVWRRTLPTKQTQVFLDTISEIIKRDEY